jgi:hypothetical protein
MEVIVELDLALTSEEEAKKKKKRRGRREAISWGRRDNFFLLIYVLLCVSFNFIFFLAARPKRVIITVM